MASNSPSARNPITFAINRPTGVLRSIDSEHETTDLSCSRHQPNRWLSRIALRRSRSNFQHAMTSNSGALLLSQSPSWGVSKGSTDPLTSTSVAHPTTAWPDMSTHCWMTSRCRSIEVDSSVD